MLLLSISASAQIPTSGLLAYYPFNGNAINANGNGLNGNNLGASLTTDRNANNNSAYNFTFANAGWGTQNNEIYIPYSSALNVSNISLLP